MKPGKWVRIYSIGRNRWQGDFVNVEGEELDVDDEPGCDAPGASRALNAIRRLIDAAG